MPVLAVRACSSASAYGTAGGGARPAVRHQPCPDILLAEPAAGDQQLPPCLGRNHARERPASKPQAHGRASAHAARPFGAFELAHLARINALGSRDRDPESHRLELSGTDSNGAIKDGAAPVVRLAWVAAAPGRAVPTGRAAPRAPECRSRAEAAPPSRSQPGVPDRAAAPACIRRGARSVGAGGPNTSPLASRAGSSGPGMTVRPANAMARPNATTPANVAPAIDARMAPTGSPTRCGRSIPDHGPGRCASDEPG